MTARAAGRPRGGDDWVERVRAATDIVELVGQTVSLKRVGRSWVGLCPFHDDHHPSLHVDSEACRWYCFGCRRGGGPGRLRRLVAQKVGARPPRQVVRPAPDHPDFFLACGFVGHGFMMAPIVAKLYAEWLTGGSKHEIFERYTLGRFSSGAPPGHETEDFNIG